ncbi:MAG: hypothetical protein MR018_07640 [Clostridiales bacterium]|nr:hypothetical protein [Clostridiales bacterium]MDY5346841.1 hypothetical protein [Eubacteriales bacterium]
MHHERDLKPRLRRSGLFRIVSCPFCGRSAPEICPRCAHRSCEYDGALQTADEASLSM